MSDDTLRTLGLSEDALTPATNANGETFTPLAAVMDEVNEEAQADAVPRVSTQRRRPSDYARSFIQQKFALQTNRAQVVFERVYGRTDNYLTFLTVSIADRGMLKLAERLEGELDKRFEKIESEIEAACTECDRLFDERRVPVANRRALSDKTRIYDVPLRTNFSARFLQLFSRFDELLCRVEALWINGIIRASGRSQMIEKWDRQVRSFTGSIRSLRDRTLQELRRLQSALWINGIIRASGRSQMIEKWDRQVRSFTGSIRSLRDRTLQELRRLQSANQARAAASNASEAQPKDEQDAIAPEHDDEHVEALSFQETTPEGASLQADGKDIGHAND